MSLVIFKRKSACLFYFLVTFQNRIINIYYLASIKTKGIRGAMVARLTPDQKVACSIHVGFKSLVVPTFFKNKKTFRAHSPITNSTCPPELQRNLFSFLGQSLKTKVHDKFKVFSSFSF